jgi:phosphoenolpyruvate-protein kinase (PTS system EI component)
VSDFVCIGTNDLAASAFGIARDAAATLDARVIDLVRDIVAAAHAHEKRVSVCGELAADPASATKLVEIGVDALSMASGRLPQVRLALARRGG